MFFKKKKKKKRGKEKGKKREGGENFPQKFPRPLTTYTLFLTPFY